MRQWSEEQRSGTLEVLLTLPVRRVELVLGKFLAVMALVALALALTLFLPITVCILGNLDWGPVVGGYLAALLLAAAYAAIGLFVSSRTDNQIVSLILTVCLGGLFYLVGTDGVTGLAGEPLGEVLRALGTGSRFESIERGVIDLRDLVYYLSLTALFLVLNVVSLDAKRWSRGTQTAAYRRQVIADRGPGGGQPGGAQRLALPAGRAARRPDRRPRVQPVAGHPGPAPQPAGAAADPRLLQRADPPAAGAAGARPSATCCASTRSPRAARSRSRSSIPATTRSWRPRPTRSTASGPRPSASPDRYESSIINSYFDILIRYGDQHVVLGFRDLIEVESQPGSGERRRAAAQPGVRPDPRHQKGGLWLPEPRRGVRQHRGAGPADGLRHARHPAGRACRRCPSAVDKVAQRAPGRIGRQVRVSRSSIPTTRPAR